MRARQCRDCRARTRKTALRKLSASACCSFHSVSMGLVGSPKPNMASTCAGDHDLPVALRTAVANEVARAKG